MLNHSTLSDKQNPDASYVNFVLSAAWWFRSHICSIVALLPQAKCLFVFLFLHECQVLKLLKIHRTKVGQKLSGQPADMQGSLLKMMRGETKQEVVKVDSFSVFWLCCVFNFYLSIQMTRPDSHQTLQLAHRCAFFYVQTNPTLSTSVSVKLVQFPSFIHTENFHVRQLLIQRKPDRHRDGERHR